MTLLDRLLIELDHALRTSLSERCDCDEPSPAANIPQPALSDEEQALSVGLMRINHTGEIAAQALYRGQAVVAGDQDLRQHLLQAAKEEQDHLQWCHQRLQELHGHRSALALAWYGGSFLIGVAAGLAGDRWNLGFVEETENQVSEHLDDHLQRLPQEDQRSRAIVHRMRADEARHAEAARKAGARALPAAVKISMGKIADLMRFVSFRL